MKTTFQSFNAGSLLATLCVMSFSLASQLQAASSGQVTVYREMCARLGLKAAAISSQVIQRDRHAAYVATLAVIASTLDKIATEVRHLQRTEVREAEEFFSEKQKGSSAMPHKRNPVTAEQISGLARVVRSNAQAGFENVALWHERDISHSSAERVIRAGSLGCKSLIANAALSTAQGHHIHRNRWASDNSSLRLAGTRHKRPSVIVIPLGLGPGCA